MLPSSFTPNFLKQLELLELQSKRRFLGRRQGGHLSPKKGSGIEFADYRKYELGDSPRDIDWGVYARTDRLYVKRFQEEQELSILVLIDGSLSMRIPDASKWSRAVETALALSYIGLYQHDSVSLAVLGGDRIGPVVGPRSFYNLAAFLSKQNQYQKKGKEILSALDTCKIPGTAVFISDFLFPFEEAVGMLNLIRSKNLEISLIQILGARDIDPAPSGSSAVFVDAENQEQVELHYSSAIAKEYQSALENHIIKLRSFARSAGIHFIPTRSDADLVEFVTKEVQRTGLLR